MKLKKGHEYYCVQWEITDHEGNPTGHSMLQDILTETTGLANQNHFEDIKLHESRNVKNLPSDPLEAYTIDMQFMNDDSEGNITRAIVQGFSLVCQGNQRSVLMTEKAVMNGYNHKNRPVIRLPVQQLKMRRGQTEAVFGAANVPMAGEEGKEYEAHIAPTYPISEIRPSQKTFDEAEMAACPTQVYEYNNNTEELIEAAVIDSQRRFSTKQDMWTEQVTKVEAQRRASFAELDASTVFAEDYDQNDLAAAMAGKNNAKAP